MILLQATKYFIYQTCLDTLFDKVLDNFKKLNKFEHLIFLGARFKVNSKIITADSVEIRGIYPRDIDLQLYDSKGRSTRTIFGMKETFLQLIESGDLVYDPLPF